MQSFYYIALLLCIFSFLSPVLSIQCNETHYSWPVERPEMCCEKCAPGNHMLRRPEKTCGIQCGPCTGNRYADTYNVQMSCSICEVCNKPNMEYESHCTTTHNAVCRCKAGFRCPDQQCLQCIPVPTTTTKPTFPPSTTALQPFTSTTLRTTTETVKDTMWYLVIVALLCLGFFLFAVTKLKPFLFWIRSKQGYLLAEKPTPLPASATEDEGVSKPVQEMCGKCDQPIDV